MEDKVAVLRTMRICRFCLTDKEHLSSIYEKDLKNAVPLPLQIMACVAIEVFANDGMPQLICDDCRLQTRKSYSFKTMCKKAEDALKLFLATGVLPKIEKEEILLQSTNLKRNSDSPSLPQNTKRTKTVDSSTQSEDINKENQQHSEIEEKVKKTIRQIKEEMNAEKEANQSKSNKSNVETQEEIETHDLEEIDFEVENVSVNSVKKTAKKVATRCFACDQCSRTFPLQQLLDIHMRQHTKERKFTCDLCDKKFFSRHDVNKHALTHSGERPFSCVACNKSFSRASLLHRHEKVHRGAPKYLCTYCDKTYLTYDDLDTHMLTHRKKRPYKCETCDKRFAFKQGLERHEITHLTEYHHKCDYCSESFTTPGKLASHITTHAGERPYPCKLCHRTFLLSHHLTRHSRLHYNQKNNQESGEHKCDYCSMSFRRKDSLINHTAIHSMVNLKCIICNKEFSDAQTVKKHVQTHLYGLKYPCDFCDYSFETQEELEDHAVKHDEELEEDEVIPEELPKSNKSLVSTIRLEEVNYRDEEEVQLPVRRSQRITKVKNYADFLKDDIETDSEEEEVDEPDDEEETAPKVQIGSIQPVIRSDTIKVYKGVKEKSITDQKTIVKESNLEPVETQEPAEEIQTEETQTKQEFSSRKSVTKITTLENLGITKQTLDAITDKSGFAELKVGQKVVRVQKLMLTKAEYEAMTKKGKIDVKGSKIIVPNPNAVNLAMQVAKNASDPLSFVPPNIDVQITKSPVKTYIKKIKCKDELHTENIVVESIVCSNPENSATIDLDVNTTEEETSLRENDILGNFD